MCQYLPYSGFIGRLDVNSIGENSSIGYILEVDLEYSSELHKLHNDYPLAPKSLKLVKICQNIVLILQMNLE